MSAKPYHVFFENILKKLPSRYLELDLCVRRIYAKYSHHYTLGMEMSCAASPDDNSISFMPLAESYKKCFYTDEEKDISLLRYITYQLIPIANKPFKSGFTFTVKMCTPDVVNIYIATYARDPVNQWISNRKSYLEQQSKIKEQFLLFIDQYNTKAAIPMRRCTSFTNQIVSEPISKEGENLCEWYNTAFNVFHDTETRMSTPRFNLHMAFDMGFLSDLPLELRELIMNKIDCGNLSYIPGQFTFKSSPCLSL